MPDQPDFQWFGPADNRWGVRLLDVRPVTQTYMSTSKNPQFAANAVSFGQDDGHSFLTMEPTVQRTVPANLQYRKPALLKDGALFRPSRMEHKWAIFYLQRRILFVRSWQRMVMVVAETKDNGDKLDLVSLRGAFAAEQEPADFTVRCCDYMMHSHALSIEYPTPLLPGDEQDANKAAFWCFSCFGCMSVCATPDAASMSVPEELLKTS